MITRFLKMMPLIVGLSILFIHCKSDADKGVNPERTSSLDEFIRIPTNDQGEIDTANMPKIHLASTEHRFDTIMEGDKVEHYFEFTNAGSSPLLISEVKTDCGCAVAEYPEDPIAPGEKGKILAGFNSTDRSGTQRKKIVLIANTYPQQTELFLEGFVKPNKNK